MDKDSDFDIDKLNNLFEVLKLESNSVLSDASYNLENNPENNHFVEIGDGDCAEKDISDENKLQNFGLNNNIKSYLMKNIKIEDDRNIFPEKSSTQVSLTENKVPLELIKREIEDVDHLFKLVSLTDLSSSDHESFDEDFNKKEIEDEDHFIKLESFTDSPSLDDESFDGGVIKKETEDGYYFIELESFTDSSSSDDDEDTLIERGGPDKNKTNKRKETVYERRVPLCTEAPDRPRLVHPSSSVPILRNNFRSCQQAQTSLPPKCATSARQIEWGCTPESLYVNSPDSGIGSPSQIIVSPSTHITSSHYIFPVTIKASPSSHAVSQLTPIASPSSHIGSPSQSIFSPSVHTTSSHYIYPPTPNASPSSQGASLLESFAPPSSLIGSPSQPTVSPSPHVTSPSSPYIFPLTPNDFPSSHPISLLAPTAFPSEDVVYPSEHIASPLSHIVSSLPPIAPSSSHVVFPSASTLDSVLPFDYENNNKESKISELINSFIKAEEYIKEIRQLQQNAINHDSNRDDIKQLVEKRYDPIYSEKANTSKNLKNENTSLEGVLSHLLITDLFQEPDKVSDELWNDKLNDLYDSVCNPNTCETTISSLKNSKHVASKFPVKLYKPVREEDRGNHKISYQIKENAKMALRNSKCFDVEKYRNEIKNVLTKIKYQEKRKKKVKIIDFDEREEFKNLNQTNLHSAVIESNVEKVLCLVEILKRYDHAFFDINCRDANKKTALDYAIQENIPLLVNYLKENNAVHSISV